MTPDSLLPTLHPLEVKVLRAFARREEISPDGLGPDGVAEAQARTALEWLLAKGVLSLLGETKAATVNLTEIGRRWAEEGLPEARLFEAVRAGGPRNSKALQEELGLEAAEVGTAIGALKRMKAVVLQAGGVVEAAPAADLSPLAPLLGLLARLRAAGGADVATLPEAERKAAEEGSSKRGAKKGPFTVAERTARRYGLADGARALVEEVLRRGLSGEEVSVLTPEMLRDGSWRGKTFRRYNLTLPPPRAVVGRRNAYREFLDLIKRELLALGFEEMRGPLVESEFWNMDALFMPQFHPAREIHDVYFVKDPARAKELPEPEASRVKAAHEGASAAGPDDSTRRGGGASGAPESRGWGYRFDRERTRRLVLRSQGTALSARMLRSARVPGKYFGIARCFRFDTVDATHAADFFQVEGIVLDERIHFGHLLGLLRLFALEVARAPECRFVPAYFPFTEPSVEVHMRHPTLGWMELGGAGIFRPEVTGPQGVSAPVIAWGLGLDRMAMVALGISDIRELFSANLDLLRQRRLG